MIAPSDAQALLRFVDAHAGVFALAVIEVDTRAEAKQLVFWLRAVTTCDEARLEDALEPEVVKAPARGLLALHGTEPERTWSELWSAFEARLPALGQELAAPCVVLVPTAGARVIHLGAPALAMAINLWLGLSETAAEPRARTPVPLLEERTPIGWSDVAADLAATINHNTADLPSLERARATTRPVEPIPQLDSIIELDEDDLEIWSSTGTDSIIELPSAETPPPAPIPAPEVLPPVMPDGDAHFALEEARRHLDAGALDEAERALFEAHNKAAEGPTRVAALRGLAKVWEQRGEWDQSLAFLRRAMDLLKGAADAYTRGLILGDAAHVRARMGELEVAVQLLEKKLFLVRAAGDEPGEATALDELAQLHTKRRDRRRAVQLQRQALGVWRRLEDPAARGQAAHRLARLLLAEGALEDAMDLHTEELAAYEAAGDRESYALAFTPFARALVQAGHMRAAFSIYQQGLRELEARNEDHEHIVTLVDVATLEMTIGRTEHAYARLQKAKAIALRLGDLAAGAHIEARLGQLLTTVARYEEAHIALVSARKLFEQLDHPSQVRQVDRLIGQLMALYDAHRT